MDLFLEAALEEARKGLEEGGVPSEVYWYTGMKLSEEVTIEGFRKIARYFMPKWMP